MLWLGTNLSNGQWYQSTIIVEFKSYCDDLRFYDAKEHQIVYVSIEDRMPFYFIPQPVVAVTKEIEAACKSERYHDELLLYD